MLLLAADLCKIYGLNAVVLILHSFSYMLAQHCGMNINAIKAASLFLRCGFFLFGVAANVSQ